ncbi:MAG: penicillin-binding protein activator LpoB [Sodalis sp. (in: enterobacteria)]
MKKKAFILLTVLVLTSCTSRKPAPSLALIKLSMHPVSVTIQQPPPATSEPMPIPPKIKTIDWQSSLSSLVQKMLAVEGINDGNVLLVNTMKNATNGNLQTSKATETLTNLILAGGGKFQVIDAKQLNAARQNLGLFSYDSLESRSKAVWLARYLNAKYVLYSVATGDVQQPGLDLQLMLVKTGEIIWSGNSIAQD